MMITRRHFLKINGALLTLLPLSQILGCGSDTPSAETPATTNSCPTSAIEATISANHGHELTVPHADAVAATDQTYSIAGSGGHDHTVTVTAAQFTALAAGQSVTGIVSSSTGHTHSISLLCAAT